MLTFVDDIIKRLLCLMVIYKNNINMPQHNGKDSIKRGYRVFLTCIS